MRNERPEAGKNGLCCHFDWKQTKYSKICFDTGDFISVFCSFLLSFFLMRVILKSTRFTPRVLLAFKKRCLGHLPKTNDRHSLCVHWEGAFRTRKQHQHENDFCRETRIISRVPCLNKTPARKIAYYVATRGKMPPGRAIGTYCRNECCINPWHVKWSAPKT